MIVFSNTYFMDFLDPKVFIVTFFSCIFWFWDHYGLNSFSEGYYSKDLFSFAKWTFLKMSKTHKKFQTLLWKTRKLGIYSFSLQELGKTVISIIFNLKKKREKMIYLVTLPGAPVSESIGICLWPYMVSVNYNIIRNYERQK